MADLIATLALTVHVDIQTLPGEHVSGKLTSLGDPQLTCAFRLLAGHSVSSATYFPPTEFGQQSSEFASPF